MYVVLKYCLPSMEIMEEISSNGLMAATLKDCHLENYEVQQISAYICEWVGGFSLLAEKLLHSFTHWL